MAATVMRTMFMVVAFTGLAACSQQQGGQAETQAARRARLRHPGGRIALSYLVGVLP